MRINYDWIAFESFDKESLKNYCQSLEEIEFCWWVSGDIGGDIESLNEIISLINKSIISKVSIEWGGNSDILEIKHDEVIIFNPMHNRRMKYRTDEFLQELNKWKELN